jgi:hypothetical protein
MQTLLVAILACALVVPAFAQDAEDADTPDPLRTMMEETDLKYKVIDEYSYLVPFELGEDEENTLDVFVTYNNDEKKFVLIFCTILDYEDGHDFRGETLARAMKINNDYPVIKLCLDADNGDLDCQSEVYVRTMDATSLEMYINFVASMTLQFFDELHALEEEEAVG